MNAHKEFVNLVNSAIENRKGGKADREFRVIVPVPKEFSIDCEDVSDIKMENVVVSMLDEKNPKDRNGNILMSRGMNAVFYEVSGIIKE